MKINRILALITTLGFCLSPAFADSAVPKDYPLKKCVVSNEDLGSGDMTPFKVTHEGTDVWLCCKSCKGKFDKAPAKFTQAVKDAAPKK